MEQADVFAQADLVVCHGGSGTAFGALAAGVPVVVVPVFADQFENGRRIAEVGAGLVVPHDDASRIAQAIETMLVGASYRAQARRIAAEIAVRAQCRHRARHIGSRIWGRRRLTGRGPHVLHTRAWAARGSNPAPWD